MINITFLNGLGGGFGESEEVEEATTVEAFFKAKWPYGDPKHFQIAVNGEEVPGDQILNEGDRVLMVARAPEAQEEGYGLTPPSSAASEAPAVSDDYEDDDYEDDDGLPVDEPEKDTFQVLFINNEGAGFAEKVDVPSGTSISQFLEAELPDTDLSDRNVTVNGAIVSADYPLALGDKIAVTPLKVDAAADRVLLVKNDGTGFADYVNLPSEPVTITDFLREHVDDFNPETQMIRVNNMHVAEDYILRPGDKVSVTPQKVDGGRR